VQVDNFRFRALVRPGRGAGPNKHDPITFDGDSFRVRLPIIAV